MRNSVCCAALAAVFVLISATAFAQSASVGAVAVPGGPSAAAPAASKVAELQAKVSVGLTDEARIYDALGVALGTAEADVKAFQAECGVPVSGSIGLNTDECLRTIAGAIARSRAASAAGQKAVEDELVDLKAKMKKRGVSDPLAEVKFTPLANVQWYADKYCASGTQVRWLNEATFTCADPVFRVIQRCNTVAGVTTCTPTGDIAPLGMTHGRGDLVPIPDPVVIPDPPQPPGLCDGTGGVLFCYVFLPAVVIGAGTGLYCGISGNCFKVLR